MTNVEKQARKRAKIKSNPIKYSAMKEKDKLHKAKARATAKANMTASEWLNHRAQENARIKELRHRKAAKDTSKSEVLDVTPYKSRQSLGKALSKVRNALPSSPRKKKAVVQEIAKGIGLKFEQAFANVITKNEIGQEIRDKIDKFYQTDDISWQAPGIKDRVIVRQKDEKGKSIKMVLQSRYMLMSLAEAHKMFCDEYKDLYKIGLSKFCDLRPPNVKLFNMIPHNVCVCEYHENVRLLLAALKNHTSLPNDVNRFSNSMMCSEITKGCATRECTNCKDKLQGYAPQTDDNHLIKYYQWQKDQVEKVEITSSVTEAFVHLQQLLNTFLMHVYIKRKQAGHIKMLKESVDGITILMQVDFSENASLLSQNEIQSCHWSHGQVTLFTAYAWIDEGIKESFVIISDELQHTKVSVYAFMDYLIKFLKSKYSTIKNINVFSDGASSQFKQRFLFSNLYLWEQQHTIKMAWHFFATSHGKGVVDGLGGTVKRSVWRYVRTGKTHVSTPITFYEVARERNPNVNIAFITSVNIAENQTMLEQHWQDTKPVPNTHKLHYVKSSGKFHINVAETSDSPHLCIQLKKPQEDDEDHADEQSQQLSNAGANSQLLEIAISDWVIVQYDGVQYPGEVVEVDTNMHEVKVNVMHRAGAYWKWPCNVDNIQYKWENVVRKINPPEVAGTRGQFRFHVEV